MKKEFVFHVFSHVLDTPRSSKFLVTYHVDRDPRKLYQDLLHEFSGANPHTANLETELEDWLGSTLLNDKWQRSIESFYDTFEKKLTMLESTCGHPVPERQKLTWLKRAITPHPTFNSAYVKKHGKIALVSSLIYGGPVAHGIGMLLPVKNYIFNSNFYEFCLFFIFFVYEMFSSARFG